MAVVLVFQLLFITRGDGGRQDRKLLTRAGKAIWKLTPA